MNFRTFRSSDFWSKSEDSTPYRQDNNAGETGSDVTVQFLCSVLECEVLGRNKKEEEIKAFAHATTLQTVESLIPQAARLLLGRTDDINRNVEDVDCEDDTEFRVELNPEDNHETDRDFYELEEGLRDSPFSDYGLEVIQEETESQMSSDSEYDGADEMSSKRKSMGSTGSENNSESVASETLNYASSSIMGRERAESPLDAVPKHIKLPLEWNPEPILARLYDIGELGVCSSAAANGGKNIEGHLLMLSGNRKKGTYWNAWRRKYCVLKSGKLVAYDKQDCEELFLEIQLSGAKVDYLDPVEFVGIEKGKGMVNRIIGVDDGVGHYYVFQCVSTQEASTWSKAIQQAANSADFFMTPLRIRSPSMFRDIFLVDIGSTNIRAGVVANEPTLPMRFMNAVMSENLSSGRIIYGNDAYIPENRSGAKLRFPFEFTSKYSQNKLDVEALTGFLRTIFADMAIAIENYRIILNLPRRLDAVCRAKVLQTLFDDFQVRGAILYHQSLAAFWAHSVPNGIICDVGERCDIVPVTHGFVMSQAWLNAPLGGMCMKDSLRQGLGPQENGLYLSTPIENLVLRFIAENFTCVSSGTSRRPSQEAEEIIVEMDLRDVLPFSNLIGVNQDVLRTVAEGFFDPGYYGLDCDGLPKLLLKSIQACEMDVRREISRNILLVGGCSLIPGFAERLEMELTKLSPSHLKPKIMCSPYRYHASFIGSTVLAATAAFEKSIQCKSTYDGGPGPSYWMI